QASALRWAARCVPPSSSSRCSTSSSPSRSGGPRRRSESGVDAMDTQLGNVRRRLLGLLLFAVVVGFVALTVLQSNQAFSATTTVYLVADSAGNSLPDRADVKARGVLMGTVGSTEAQGDKVVLRLDLDPDTADEIPRDATARLLPKTLFGESYVALQIPKD